MLAGVLAGLLAVVLAAVVLAGVGVVLAAVRTRVSTGSTDWSAGSIGTSSNNTLRISGLSNSSSSLICALTTSSRFAAPSILARFYGRYGSDATHAQCGIR